MAPGYPKRHSERPPTHPGKILKDTVLPALELNVSEAARALGISRQSLHAILAGTAAVTPEMALRIGKLCGNGPQLWLGLQQAHDLWHAEHKMELTLGSIETRKALTDYLSQAWSKDQAARAARPAHQPRARAAAKRRRA